MSFSETLFSLLELWLTDFIGVIRLMFFSDATWGPPGVHLGKPHEDPRWTPGGWQGWAELPLLHNSRLCL